MARRERVSAYLLGAASVLVAQALVGAAVLMPPTDAVAGTAEPAAERKTVQRQQTGAKQSEPTTSEEPDDNATSRDEPKSGEERDRDPEPDVTPAPSGQRPGTILLPDGGSAALVRHELGPDAVLPVPENLGEATWWGAGLGAPSGASVFAGHVNWQGREGPFSELWQVRVGERVTIADDGGKKFRYEVSRILTLDKDEVPARASELFGQSGRHRAVLVTCGGNWQGGTTGYEENRVVIAEPV
ncbi:MULTISPECIES: class F sortase [Prauserella salsuginis group]|uniref:Class F sortase n=1 Tax=Prauserella salsuginis TaxID=387889 RepID=A0ABW6G8U8_9PSEU|nr:MULTISPECIES: class F sortase [Prauserella salsuginis group]MCR3722484.1 Sortase family protein [Prauserella flava]MCR3736926.1 Sortase family protein [Prauserella salsuginis]